MRLTDLWIVAFFLALVLFVGLFGRRRPRSREEFFVAGRSLGWIPLGLSVMVTVFSAVNFLAFSSEVAANGLYVLMVLPAFGLAAAFVCVWAIPVYRRLSPVSVYELLESRLGAGVRKLAAALFILWRAFWMAAALYACGRLMNGLTGMDAGLYILAIGGLAVIYTSAGGMRSVVRTDIVQFAVLFGALLAAVAVSVVRHGGAAELAAAAVERGLMRPFLPFDAAAFSLHPGRRMTWWSCVIGGTVAFAGRYGADQMVVQRYLSASSLSAARRGLILSICGSVFALLCLTVLGLAIGVGAEADAPPPRKFADFAAAMPAGLGGLLVAGLLAAAMSSIDSGIHSCATVVMTDFNASGRIESGGRPAAMWRVRLVTLAVGALVCALGCVVGAAGSLFEVANKIVNGFGSPLLALMLLAAYPRGVTRRGVLAGGFAGACWSAYTAFFVRHLALHYYAVINLAGTLALCFLFSLADRIRRSRGSRPKRLSRVR